MPLHNPFGWMTPWKAAEVTSESTMMSYFVVETPPVHTPPPGDISTIGRTKELKVQERVLKEARRKSCELSAPSIIPTNP